MNGFRGFAVIDTETTGILPGFQHRVAEIAVVHLDRDGAVTGSWETLVNPQRDLGPQAVHGIRAADARRAPLFADIAADVVDLVDGRILVAHNWAFDAMHLRAEFERIGVDTPFRAEAGICTMRLAGSLLRGPGRSLVDCCAAVGLDDREWHTAGADAMAAAELFALFLREGPRSVRIGDEHLDAVGWRWKAFARNGVAAVRRRPSGHVAPHFLARMVDRIPRSGEPVLDGYLAMLDRALLDRLICESEADEIVDLAYDLGLSRAEAVEAHHGYLRALARAAWNDGVVTEQERTDIVTVAVLLGLDKVVADEVIDEERISGVRAAPAGVSPGGLVLQPGDTVVLTGTMNRGRKDLTDEARALGLRMASAVSRRTTVVVAADPDSMSGKARDARTLGVPVVGEEAFCRVLGQM